MSINRPSKDDQGESRFEEHLREFRPLAPRELKIPAPRVHGIALAVAASMVLIVGASIGVYRHRHSEVKANFGHPANPTVLSVAAPLPLTLGLLNAAWRDNDKDFNYMLDETSSQLLPRPDQGTALFELGKD